MTARTRPPTIAATADATVQRRRAWQPEEDEELRRLCQRGLSQRVIAGMLGRRASSVACRMRLLRIEPTRTQSRRPAKPTWPDWLRFEDDPRACRREPLWRGEPVPERSPHGCATALLENEA